MRIFIAVRVTDESLIKRISAVQQELDFPDMRIKWVESYNLHVTLKFIGEIDEQTCTMIENIMQGVFKKTKPFDVQFDGFGVFPNLQSPRVIWAGIGAGADILRSYAEKLNDTLALLNVRSEVWNYQGHLTLGRIKSSHNVSALLDRMKNLSIERLGSMHIESVELMESKLTASGPEYRILKAVPIGS